MISRSARDSNRAHLRVEKYFVEELEWSSVGTNPVTGPDDPIGTEPSRIGGVYIDPTDGHYAVLVRAVSRLSAGKGAATEEDSSASTVGSEKWFANRLDNDAGVHAPHMRKVGYWRLVADVDSTDRLAIRVLNQDGTVGTKWIPPVAAGDDASAATSPMLAFTRRDPAVEKRSWWQRVPLGAMVAGIVAISAVVLSGLWYAGQRATEPSAIVITNSTPTPTSAPTPANTPVQATKSIDLDDLDDANGATLDEQDAETATPDPANTSADAASTPVLAEGAASAANTPALTPTTSEAPGEAGSSTPQTGSSGAQTGSSGAQTGSSGAQTGSSGAETGSSGAETGSSTAQTGSAGAESAQTPPPAESDSAPSTCQGSGYALTVPAGWSHDGCKIFDPGAAVADCICLHHIDVATATAESFDEAIARITTSNGYTVSSQNPASVNGRDAQRFELIAHTASGDVAQTVLVVNAPTNVFFAAASQHADAGSPASWDETLVAFDSIVDSLIFG